MATEDPWESGKNHLRWRLRWIRKPARRRYAHRHHDGLMRKLELHRLTAEQKGMSNAYSKLSALINLVMQSDLTKMLDRVRLRRRVIQLDKDSPPQ